MYIKIYIFKGKTNKSSRCSSLLWFFKLFGFLGLYAQKS